MTLPIAVFAHNEERKIVACLESLYAGGLERGFRAYVLANGCTDGTVAVVREYSATHPEIQLVEISLGDKANAWNVYVRDVGVPAPVHFFVDGDVEVGAGSLAALRNGLEEHPEARAAAAVPATGRHQEYLRHGAVAEHGLQGNLYALAGEFLERIRERKLYLPIGLIGDDSWIGALAKWDLDPDGKWRQERVVPVPSATFLFHSLRRKSLGDIRLYWRRRLRYALRHWQIQMLREYVHERGLSRLPSHVTDLYPGYASRCRNEWAGGETLLRWIVLKRLRTTHEGMV